MALTPEQILDYSVKYASGQTKYQNEIFVGKTHVTKYRQVRQALLELENRTHSLKKIEFEIEREKVHIEHIEQCLEECNNEYERKLLEIDHKDKKIDVEIAERKYKRQVKESEHFIKMVQEECETEEDLLRYWNDDDEEEKKYWIARMGKQAAMDILSFGRISVGNLDSISMMPEEDQLKALSVGFQYSNLLGAQLQKIERALKPAANEILRDPNNFSLPTWDHVEDALSIPLHDMIAGGSNPITNMLESGDDGIRPDGTIDPDFDNQE
tara:strand:+ start:3505 stop:4311 length:807 start_codon:yes stop_codon:yes gene_type:complete